MARLSVEAYIEAVHEVAISVLSREITRYETIDSINELIEQLDGDYDRDDIKVKTDVILAESFADRGFETINWSPKPIVIDRYVHNAEEERMDYEANWFAAAFLMAEEEFKRIWAEKEGRLVEIGAYFGVAPSLVKARGIALGLYIEDVKLAC